MKDLNCFTGDINTKLLDREPFRLNHKLVNHPALTLENIARIIPDHPKEKVMFSKGLDSLTVNFDKALDEDKKDLNILEVIETIRTSNSYIAIRSPELHPSFKELYHDMIGDVETFMKANGTGTKAHEPMLWLFIASPGAVTPFHFDRFSNFIMQIRGSKELAVFPPGLEEIVSARDTEAYLDRDGESPIWRDELDVHANKFNFKMGEAVHIPYTSGHYVKNGTEDISITLSVFYHSDETLRWSRAMRFNNRLRRRGLNPSPVRQSVAKDKFKAALFPYANKILSTLSKLKS